MIDFQPLSPAPDGDQGNHDKRGKFAKGNRAGRGNPHARRIAAWRREWAKAATPEVLAEVIRQLLAAGQQGERWAVVEILSRTLGKGEVVDVFHHADPSEPQRVKVTIDGNWYGNQSRLAEIAKQREEGP